MSEDSEMWAAVRRNSQEKRRRNEVESIAVLRRCGIRFELLSAESSHYRVGRFSFWPTTGKFYDETTGEKGRGVFNLINIIQSLK
jgi:hypothetical protein